MTDFDLDPTQQAAQPECRIVLLDDNTANRIAAGEVVERPASVVKELVENAIDAGATRIRVRLLDGGKRLIEVADNGCGMTAEEAVLALQRHATSKIRSADDLASVATLGFRGEALPSIASVSHLQLVTKTAACDAGCRVTVHGGDIEAAEPEGCSDGTTLAIEDLFYNTPARLKFLKTTPTELARSVETVGHLAVSHPGISFHLLHDDQTVLQTPGAGDAIGALAALWGRETARTLAPISGESNGVGVEGFIAPPDIHRPGRSHELFYVNRRPIRSRFVSHAVEDAYRTLTPDARFPVAVVLIDVNPLLVDVNVHPTKMEVKFTNDREVHHAVSQSVRAALAGHGQMPTLTPPRTFGWRSSGREANSVPSSLIDAVWTPPSAPEPGAAVPGPSLGLPGLSGDPFAPEPEPLAAGEPGPGPEQPFGEMLRGFRVLGQARRTYIVAATEHGLALIDQHVAHERVLYERLLKARNAQGIHGQRLAVPFTVELGAAEAELVRQKLSDFRELGWELEAFGREAFLVRAVPALSASRGVEQLLRDMIDELVHQTVARRLVVQRDHVTITNACKMAVKAGDPLQMPEMEGLLEQLAHAKVPFACPHGRPAVVLIPYGEIDRRFKR